MALPIAENIKEHAKGRVFCLTDTDSNMIKKDIVQESELKNSLILKRLCINEQKTISLVKFETEVNQTPIDIEKSLNPLVFIKTLEELDVDEKFLIPYENIQDTSAGTTKENLRSFEIDDYFSSESIKNEFASKYIEIMGIMESEDSSLNLTPNWLNEIKEFYNYDD